MTPFGVPETERELTLAQREDVSLRDLMTDPLDDGCLSLVDAAEAMGVPVLVLQRWCDDGTVSREMKDGSVEACYRGRPARPASLRVERAWVDDFTQRGEVVL